MDNVHVDYESELKLDNLYFSNVAFRRKRILQKGKLSLKLSKITKFTKGKAFTKLIADVIHEKDSFALKITLNGEFSLKISYDPIMAKTLIEKNTIAIMFPYIRSQISLLTTQPGMNTVIIPPINVNQFIDEQEKKSQEI